jgi:hypothetical protein
MNFFQILNKIFFNKKNHTEQANIEDINEFSPYMTNRWLSFYDKTIINFVNDYLNKYNQLFTDMNQTFMFYYHFIPSLKYKKINYFKRKKEKDTEEFLFLPKNTFYSVREIKQMRELLKNIQ